MCAVMISVVIASRNGKDPFFCCCLCDYNVSLFVLYREDKARIKLPRDMEDAKGLGRALSNYNDEYFTQVLLGFVIIYILYPFGVACLNT